MNQDEINDAEWGDPENWTDKGETQLCVYFSHKDSRMLVPKRIPVMGWTVNLAKKGGVAFLITIMLAIPMIVVIIAMLSLFASKLG